MISAPSTAPPSGSRLVAGTAAALVAFAANSLLCRAALGAATIDPATFAAVRTAAGALVLAALIRARSPGSGRGGSRHAAAALAVYMLGFSFAYVGLATGTGALILFGSVQLTMFGMAVARGQHPRPMEWVGTVIAFAGLVWLASPSVDAPPPLEAALMTAAGIGWGAYTLLGRSSRDPLRDTCGNFARALVPVLVVVVAASAADGVQIGLHGGTLAVLSGAVTSGIGYSLWYAVLPGLAATQAALLQLAVPVLAAVLGIAVLGEAPTLRLGVAMVLVLGGIGVAIRARRPATVTARPAADDASRR